MSDRDDMIVNARGAIDSCARDEEKEFIVITMAKDRLRNVDCDVITNGMTADYMAARMMMIIHQVLGSDDFDRYLAQLVLQSAERRLTEQPEPVTEH